MPLNSIGILDYQNATVISRFMGDSRFFNCEVQKFREWKPESAQGLILKTGFEPLLNAYLLLELSEEDFKKALSAFYQMAQTLIKMKE